MTAGAGRSALYLTDSPTAWRVRVRLLDAASTMVPVGPAAIERSHRGVERLFTAAFDSVVRAEKADRRVDGLRLTVQHRVLGPGNIGLWFDVLDERSRLTRMVTDVRTWTEVVDGLLGAASKEIIAVLRGQLMRLEAPPEELLVRQIPGPGGPLSRVEISIPGAPPSRMYTDLWDWAQGPEGTSARADVLAVLAAPGVERMEVIFYEGQESEHLMQLRSTPRLREFAAGR